MGIHTNHNPPVAVAAAAAAASTVAAAVAAAATVAAAVAAKVAGNAAKDLGQVQPENDLGCRVGQERDEIAKDLGRVQLGHVWLGEA